MTSCILGDVESFFSCGETPKADQSAGLLGTAIVGMLCGASSQL